MNSEQIALSRTKRESVETAIRKRRLLRVGALARMNNKRLSKRFMSGKLAGGVAARRGRPGKDWMRCLDKGRKAPEAAPTGSPPKTYGTETVDWTVLL